MLKDGLPLAAPAAEIPDQSPHYVRALADMSEHKYVVAHEDIYAANGMKLLAKGARIRGSDRERLSVHKLRAPLDVTLRAEESVDAALILSDLDPVLDRDPVTAMVGKRFGDQGGLRLAIRALQLPLPLRFRLTVMRDQRLSLYNHSLRVALLTYAMAHQLRFSHQEKGDLLLAALCHDIGEMHTDPALLDPAHEITPEERRFIDVHPLTSHVLLSDMGLGEKVLQAVLQHHERLDGSGYPHHIGDVSIGRLSRLLCVAEVVEAVGRRDGLGQLEIMLRLSKGRLDPFASNVLRGLLDLSGQIHDASAESEALQRQIAQVLDVLNCWKSITAHRWHADYPFLVERMDLLRSIALQTGLNLEDNGPLVELAREDHYVAAEIARALAELGWMMEDLGREIARRSGTIAADHRSELEPLLALIHALG